MINFLYLRSINRNYRSTFGIVRSSSISQCAFEIFLHLPQYISIYYYISALELKDVNIKQLCSIACINTINQYGHAWVINEMCI